MKVEVSRVELEKIGFNILCKDTYINNASCLHFLTFYSYFTNCHILLTS